VNKAQVEAGRAAEAFAFMRLQQALPRFTVDNWRSGNRLHFYPHLGRTGLDDTLGCVLRAPATLSKGAAPALGAAHFAVVQPHGSYDTRRRKAVLRLCLEPPVGLHGPRALCESTWTSESALHRNQRVGSGLGVSPSAYWPFGVTFPAGRMFCRAPACVALALPPPGVRVQPASNVKGRRRGGSADGAEHGGWGGMVEQV
jgi:hypothetical protein